MGAEKGRKTRSRQHRPDSGGVPQAQRGTADRKGRDFAAIGDLDRPGERNALPDDEATRMSMEGLETFDAEVERAAEGSPLSEAEAGRFVGAVAYTPDGDELGVVQDLIMDREDVVQGLVLDVGSFLGLAERLVRIDWNEIIISADGRVIVDMAVEDLEQLPPFSPR
jgi:hypothetical protein